MQWSRVNSYFTGAPELHRFTSCFGGGVLGSVLRIYLDCATKVRGTTPVCATRVRSRATLVRSYPVDKCFRYQPQRRVTSAIEVRDFVKLTGFVLWWRTAHRSLSSAESHLSFRYRRCA